MYIFKVILICSVNEVVSSRRDHVAGSVTRVLIKYHQLANNNTTINYNYKTEVIPVVVGAALGTVKK